jgi:FG-GAP repeat/Secretion system C-terminal sorting domain
MMMKIYLSVIVFFLCFLSILTASTWEEMEKILSSDRLAFDEFGYSIAIDGDYVIVGATDEDYDVNGLNYLGNAGAAYIFKRIGAAWSQVQKLVPSTRTGSEYFGYSVDISGNYAVIGTWAHDYDASGANYLSAAGAAWIFYNDAGTWVQQQKIVAPDRASSDRFGNCVAISGDVVIVGAPLEDEDASGSNTLSMAGSAYIFSRSGTTWSFDQKIVNSDRAGDDQFGISVGIDGNYAIIGAHHEDEDAEGNNTQSNAGSAYIFYNNGSSWTEQQKIVPDFRPGVYYFAYNCAIDGNRVIASTYPGASNKAFVFSRSGSIWSQEGILTPSDGAVNDWYGYDSDISGDFAIVGAWGEDEDAGGSNTLEKAGSAYIYHYDAGWSQYQKIVASDRGEDDYFGSGVGISGNYIAVAAQYEDIDGTHPNAGAAYIFANSNEVPLPIELTSFSAEIRGGVLELAWETATETNNALFVIYRNDVAIASVAGAGTTSEPHNYSYVDNTVVPGVTYTYVLADVDYANEEYKYETNAVTITVANDLVEADFMVGAAYPNPFNPSVTINYQLSTINEVRACIFDLNGTLVQELLNKTVPAGDHSLIWHASDMPSGIYIITVSAGDITRTQKIALLK